jgi:hypothetical protein
MTDRVPRQEVPEATWVNVNHIRELTLANSQRRHMSNNISTSLLLMADLSYRIN